jgi:hypothetical protein
MTRPNQDNNPQDIGFLIAELASRCGMIDDVRHDQATQQRSTQGQQNAHSNPSDPAPAPIDVKNVLPPNQFDLLKAVANELVEEQGSVAACLESLSPQLQKDTQRTAIRTHRNTTEQQLETNAEPQQSNSRFEVQRFLAKGGIGQVSVALDKQLNREVAYKEIRPDRTTDTKSLSQNPGGS